MQMIIDSHVHIKIESGDTEGSEKAIGELLECMERIGIDGVCIAPIVYNDGGDGYYPDKNSILFSADFMTEMVKRHKNRFYPLVWINGNLDTQFLMDMTKKYILNGLIRGIKIENEINATDEKLEPFANFLEKNKVPMLFHSFYSNEGRRYYDSVPSDIACLAQKHPELKIVMAHLNGCGFRGIQDIKRLPNVCIDTAGSGAEDGYLEYALKELGPDRILYGSDYPGRDFAVQLARIDSVALAPETRRKLLGENAVRIFGGDSTCIGLNN